MGSSHSYLINLDAAAVPVAAPVATTITTPITIASSPVHWIVGEECFELDVPVGKIQKALLAKGIAGSCSTIGYTNGLFT